MADNLKKRGPADAKRINVHEFWERRYWTKKLGCNEPELRAAVKAVGVMAADVKKRIADPSYEKPKKA
ncbi:MAG TPA: DUF3606 domain-containing protein [Sphingomicrobium sp.]|nr:DUF3606 domain-containing protein [Sphingomicrobium sp.]